MGRVRLIVLAVVGGATLGLTIAPWAWERVSVVGWVDHFQGSNDCPEALDVVIDPEERIWIACNTRLGYVVYLQEGIRWTLTWQGILPAHSTQGSNGKGLAAGPEAEVWLAHDKELRALGKDQGTEIPAPDLLAGNHINAINVDSLGRVWIGTWYSVPDFEQGASATVGVFDARTRAWTIYTPQNSGLPRARAVEEIAFDGKARAWLALAAAPFTVFDGTEWTTYPEMSSVTSVAVDRAGGVWVRSALADILDRSGRLSYVYYHDGRNWTRMPSKPAVCCAGPRTITFDHRGRAWVTGFDELYVLEGQSQTILNRGNSGLRLRPRAITADRSGHIWIGGEGGLQSFDASSRLTVPPVLTVLKLLWPILPAVGAALWVMLFLGIRRAAPPFEPVAARERPALTSRSVWLRWTIASTIGFSVGGIVGIGWSTLRLQSCTNDCDILAWVLLFEIVTPTIFVLGGTVSAVIQERLVLRRLVGRSGWWVLLSGAGFVSAGAMMLALGTLRDRLNLPTPLVRLLYALVPGVVVGVLQWLFLRRRVPGTAWWIPASILILGVVAWFLGLKAGPIVTLYTLGERGWFLGFALLVVIAEIIGIGVWIGMIGGGILATVTRISTVARKTQG